MLPVLTTRQIFLPGLTAHAHIHILRPFSHAEQQYFIYLYYCTGMFRVGADINKTQSNS